MNNDIKFSNIRDIIKQSNRRFRDFSNNLNCLTDYNSLNINTTISPDEVCPNDRGEAYFYAGRNALFWIELSLLLSCKRKYDINNILDIPCGHGRELRWIKSAFPDSNIVASDIDKDAVDFCANTFNVTPNYSSVDFAKVLPDTTFDLIWIGSLFSHLNSKDWLSLLDFADSKLNPGGIVIFTAAGLATARMIENGVLGGLNGDNAKQLLSDYYNKGFGFTHYPHLPNSNYGRSLAKPQWISSVLESYKSFKLVLYCEQAWDSLQDVICCEKY